MSDNKEKLNGIILKWLNELKNDSVIFDGIVKKKGEFTKKSYAKNVTIFIFVLLYIKGL